MPPKPQHRGHPKLVSTTVWVAVGLMIASGAGYSVAAGPLQIGPWNGSDTALDERLVKATDTDDHVSRSYVRSDGRGDVSLFIAYGVRFRDLMPHRPEVCYTGAGWTLEATSERTLTIEDELELCVGEVCVGRDQASNGHRIKTSENTVSRGISLCWPRDFELVFEAGRLNLDYRLFY